MRGSLFVARSERGRRHEGCCAWGQHISPRRCDGAGGWLFLPFAAGRCQAGGGVVDAQLRIAHPEAAALLVEEDVQHAALAGVLPNLGGSVAAEEGGLAEGG